MPIAVKISSTVAHSIWNEFTASHDGLVPFSFNPSLFSFYEQHFHWKPYYLMIYDGEVLNGLLPVVYTGKAWVSLPHFSYGGLLLKKEDDTNKFTGLMERLAGLFHQLDVGFYKIDLTELMEFESTLASKIYVRSTNRALNEIKSEKMTSLIFLPETAERLFQNLSSNLRRKIRRSTRLGIDVRSGKEHLLDDFYLVYTKNIKQLNSMNYSKSFFKDLLKYWEYGDCLFFVAYDQGKPVGASLMISYLSFYENVFFGTLSKYRKLYISDFLHWNMILAIFEKNNDNQFASKKIYSFGRSSVNSGVFNFKNHWPVENYPLFNYINYSDIRKKDWLYYLWGLIPGVITSSLGQRLIKHIY